MASIKEAFGEYKPNKSKVFFDAPVSLGELLDRLAAGGVPMAHTLSEFHKNPEGPISETAQVFTDEFVPFKYQIRSGEATPASLAKEAALMFVPGGPMDMYNPSRGVRRAVRTNAKGEPNKKDLKQWADYTVNKWGNVYGNAARHKYNDPFYKAKQLEKSVESAQSDINYIQHEIDNIVAERNLPDDQRGLPVEWYDKKLEGAQNRLESSQKHHAKLLNDYNEASIDALGYTPREKNWEGILRDLDRDYLFEGGGTGYVLDRLKREYGDELGKKYFNDIVEQSYKARKKDPWSTVDRDYPIAQRLLKEHGDL